MVRAAIKFDLADINKKEVSKATMKLSWCFNPTIKNIMMYGGESANHKYGIYDANKSWSADNVTWDTPWDKVGAIGYDADEIAPLTDFTPPENPKDKTGISVDVTSLVSKWVKGDIDNNGLIISAPNTTGGIADDDAVYAAFYSSEADVALRPTLVVEYADSPILHYTKVEHGISIVGMKNSIRIDAPLDGAMLVTVSNLQGKRVDSKMVTSSSVTLGENLHGGIYFVSIEQDGFTFTKKVVIK